MAVELVKNSAEWISTNSAYVTVDDEAIARMARKLVGDMAAGASLPEWDFDRVHFNDGTELTVQYLLVVDSLNFCFWPDPSFHYSDLASGLATAVREDASCIDAGRLSRLTGPDIRRLLGRTTMLPLEEERARLLNEVGAVLCRDFEGQAANLIREANGSAASLVDLITSRFRGFQDHCVFKGRQVAFCKRAQIFVADVWGSFRGQGLGQFDDISALSMFADYLVPCILRKAQILSYSASLAEKIDKGEELLPGSEEEVELRGCSIAAVERLRKALDQVASGGPSQVTSVELDWWLWSQGIGTNESQNHHRTLTVYY